ncbi:MAG: DEAD/DEAH box helicase family protein [Micrococcales bacterium]|nr:DEAD/DEAH box helicase family protein [Micrococcales bacterium]
MERYYQTRAIRAIGEHFEMDKQRRALVVMATGAGKTRTVVALTDLLMRANLGETGVVPGRPDGLGEPGGGRVQGAPARLGTGEPGDREAT